MINLNNLSKNYGSKILFEKVSLSINRGEKVGLIGPNGAGKSTLFSLILGDLEPTSGAVQISKNIHIGHLRQEASFKSENTVLSELTEGEERILALKKEKELLEEKNEAGSKRYGEILHNLEVLGYFELEHKAKKILMGLGFKERDFNRLISQMSGGWQMRALLAKLLTYKYDLLLLDEPTNYLDLNAALWLKSYLADFEGTFIMISHDKAFLTEVTNYTLILENGSIAKVKGNYEHYEQIQEEKRIYQIKQSKEQEKKREQLEKFVGRFHAQPNKAASVRAKRRVLESMPEIVVLKDRRESIHNFHFPSTKRSGWRVMNLEKISKSYGDIQVYKDLDFEITQDEKAVLAGENGAGKSTLLKIMAGVVDIDSGLRKPGHNVDVGYFSQTRMDVLHPENTVLKEAYSAAAGFMSEESIRTILGAFLFSGDDADKKVSVLSGGEKSRLILAKLLINPPNLLLLDEPTTHLDVDAVEALVKALKDYEGTLVFISHDIYFVRSVANVVYEVSPVRSRTPEASDGCLRQPASDGVKDSQVRKFPGNFDYYLEKKDKGEASLENNTSRKAAGYSRPQEQRQANLEKEKQRKEEEKTRKAHNSALRESISKLEKDKEKLELESYAKVRALSNPHIFRDEDTAREYGRRLKEIEKLISDIQAKVKELESRVIQSP